MQKVDIIDMVKEYGDSLIRELEVTKLKCGKEDKEDTRLVTSSDNSGGLTETVYLLKSPANAAHLAESIEQYIVKDR